MQANLTFVCRTPRKIYCRLRSRRSSQSGAATSEFTFWSHPVIVTLPQCVFVVGPVTLTG